MWRFGRPPYQNADMASPCAPRRMNSGERVTPNEWRIMVVPGQRAKSRSAFGMKVSWQWLLDPISPARFLETYYERQPLWIERRDPTRFRHLLSLDSVDRFLAD